jgi:hypothetical protein
LETRRLSAFDDVVQRLRERGDPWRLSEELPPITGKGNSMPPFDKA